MPNLTRFAGRAFVYHNHFSGGTFTAPVFRAFTRYHRYLLTSNYEYEYPKGLPDSTELFLLEDLVDGAVEHIKRQSEPYLAYLHFSPRIGLIGRKPDSSKNSKMDGSQI